MSYLIVKWRGEEVDRFELTGPTVVGRDFGCQIWLNDPTMSRRHCEIAPAGCGTWMVVDLDSRNGVLVDDRPAKRRVLKDGQIVRVGEAQITFCEQAAVARRPATPEQAIEQSLMQSKADLLRGGVAPATAAKVVSPKPAASARRADRDDPLTQPFGLAFQRPPAQPQLEKPTDPKPDVIRPRQPAPRSPFGSLLEAIRSLLPGSRDAA